MIKKSIIYMKRLFRYSDPLEYSSQYWWYKFKSFSSLFSINVYKKIGKFKIF